MNAKEYEQLNEQAKKEIVRIVKELQRGNANSLHYVVSGAVREHVMTELAKLRDAELVRIVKIADENLGQIQKFEAFFRDAENEYKLKITIRRVLENLRWTWKALKPSLLVKQREDDKFQRTTKKEANVKDDTAKQHRTQSKRSSTKTQSRSRKTNK
jgi:hypothetical protein